MKSVVTFLIETHCKKSFLDKIALTSLIPFFFFGVVEECGISSSSCRGFLDDCNSTLIWRSVAGCRKDDLPD